MMTGGCTHINTFIWSQLRQSSFERISGASLPSRSEAPLSFFGSFASVAPLATINNPMDFIKEHIPLSLHTTFKIGGSARYFCEAASLEDLTLAVNFAEEKKIPIFVLGEGSNTLVADQGFLGLVVKMNIRGIKIRDLEYDKVEVVAGAGEKWDSLVEFVVSKNLYGLENLSGIPGTVGAAPFQNIGAYGAELKDSVSFVEVFDTKKKKIRVMTATQCQFAYRHSIFKTKKAKNLIITKVSFVLEKQNLQSRTNIGYKDLKERFKDRFCKDVTPKEIRQAVLEIRSRKFPDLTKIGTAGSFFKNPVISKYAYEKLLKKFPEMPAYDEGRGFVKVPLGWVLDHVCNLKGWKKGNVGTHENQALVLVNLGGATASEIKVAADYITEEVKQKTDIKIEWEVQYVG
jgi:UDP-N-acetylmuramate dehydrogenase